MEPTAVVEESGEFYLSRLALVSADAWPNPTPCPGWTVRDVAAHVVKGLNLLPLLLAGKQVEFHPDEDVLGAAPVQAGRAALQSAVLALRQPGALDVVVNAPAGEMPARAFAFVRTADTVIHTWDLAVGAGIDATIPPALIEVVLAASHRRVLEAARQKGVFGPIVTVRPDADAQTALLALYGRKHPGDG